MEGGEFGTATNRLPTLRSSTEYPRWKILFKAAVTYNNAEIWKSIEEAGLVFADYSALTAGERERVSRDQKAKAAIEMGVSWDI